MEEAVVDLGIEPLELLLDRVELRADGIGPGVHVPEVHVGKHPSHAQDRRRVGSGLHPVERGGQRLERGRHRVRELALVEHESGHGTGVPGRGGGA